MSIINLDHPLYSMDANQLKQTKLSLLNSLNDVEKEEKRRGDNAILRYGFTLNDGRVATYPDFVKAYEAGLKYLKDLDPEIIGHSKIYKIYVNTQDLEKKNV